MRDGDALRRIGQGAELFDDHSPLQLGAAGTLQGAAFTLVGRLQYRTAEGTWNEWHALFDNGRSGWLSEDNGRYVFAFDAALATQPPAPVALRPGVRVLVQGQVWSVASVVQAELIAAQGELPRPPTLARLFTVADLRNAQDEVATLDYGDPQTPTWSIGRSVALSELALTGLAAASEKTLSSRNLQCPSCGNAVTVQLESTKSVVCAQCSAVIDVSQGIGGDLAHYAQSGGGTEPQIPLGSVGQLKLGSDSARPWQVVGYAERCDIPEDAEDETSFWREYLLYNRDTGFAFLVDGDDGWSWVVAATGVPGEADEVVRFGGVAYKKRFAYRARVTWVLGEFYWKLARGQEAHVTDYTGVAGAGDQRLSREQTDSEVVWSAGEAIDADTLRRAFRLPGDSPLALARDAAPTSSAVGALLGKSFLWALIIAVMLVVAMCSDGDDRDNCADTRRTFGEASAEYRNCIAGGGGARGGSFGGFSSGGSHK